jgi:hypothetical protein
MIQADKTMHNRIFEAVRDGFGRKFGKEHQLVYSRLRKVYQRAIKLEILKTPMFWLKTIFG